MKSNNGYIGVNNEYANIEKRYVGVNGSWNTEKFKFVGNNGFWRLTYTDVPISFDEDFYVTHLDGYGLNRENSLNIYGSNLKDYQLISPKTGGYFELEKNGQDLFENFAKGTFSGNPYLGELKGGIKCMGITTTSDYFQLPPDIDARGIFGTDGNKNYNIAGSIYVNTLPSGSDLLPVFSYGDRNNGLELVIDFSGSLKQIIWNGGFAKITSSNQGLILQGWSSLLITRINTVTSFYVNSTIPAFTSIYPTQPPLVNIPIRVGASFKYNSTTPLVQSLSVTRTSAKYTLSNSNRTITSLSTSAGTARSNNLISPNTGKYYFEVLIGTISTGVIWVGLGDFSIPQTSGVGIAGWSISSNSRYFNKQTGGGTTWGGGARTFKAGDVIGCVYDSNAGSATYYKNNVLLGTPTTAISGDVEFMVAADQGNVATIRINSGEWSYPAPSGAIEMPQAISYNDPFSYSVVNSGYRYFYFSNTALSAIQIQKLLGRKNPVVVLSNKLSSEEIIIPEAWMSAISNEKIGLTIPPTVSYGDYELFIRYFGQYESYKFPITLSPVTTQTEVYFDDFSDKSTLSNNFYTLNKAWGGANGGVSPENVFIRDGELIIRGNGDLYNGDVIGVDREGNPKYHTNQSDPLYSQPWKNRVGGCVVYNKRTGYGSYEIDALIPNQLGCAYALWNFFYNEIYPSDPRYNEFINEGLHQQGSDEDGYYLTRNHEIDIEFPSHIDGGLLYEPSLSNFKANTWRGELQNWDVSASDPAYWEEYRDNLTPIGYSIADGNYHKLRYDWYPDRVEFYIDDVLKQTNTNTLKSINIPDISGYFTFGIWFPSSPLAGKPWLANPLKCWGGGTIDLDGGMKANFETVEMKVRNFKFIPFNEFEAQQRNLGETYPFGGSFKKS